MKFSVHLLFLFTLLISGPSLYAKSATSERLATDWKDNATFTTLESQDSIKDRHNFGLITHSFSGWGAIYKYFFNEKQNLWIFGTYRPSMPVMVDQLDQASPAALAGWTELYKLQLGIGADQYLFLTKARNFGLLIGLGVGINQSRYKTYYNLNSCKPSCDAEQFVEVSNKYNDSHLSLLGRFGFVLNKTKIWGELGKIAFTLNPILLQAGQKFKFINPNGTDSMTFTLNSYFIEMTIDI